MLTEVLNVRQLDNDARRRWFTDDYFDLIVWYDEHDAFVGFQLCYDKTFNEYSITWKENEGFTHNRIDDGEAPGQAKMSPILIPDGAFDKESIAMRFKRESKKIDGSIGEFVHAKLLEFK
jgi:hypothetical protein